jgi:molecular chaperone DnaK (HSP70)
MDKHHSKSTSLFGESATVSGNKSEVRYGVGGILPAARWLTQIDIAFHVDLDCILTVSSKNKSTGRQQTITIVEDSNGLSEAEVDRLRGTLRRTSGLRIGELGQLLLRELRRGAEFSGRSWPR